MLNNNVYYHGSIRKTIIAFGRLFSDIYIDRKQGDSVTGEVAQRIQIPLSYAPKEKWLVRIEQDPSLENHTYTTLPRMSFEIIGYNYDSSRKVNRMQKITSSSVNSSNTSTVNTMFSPVPYNLDISMYILTKTQEDGLQIIEQILPTFTPEYTLKVNVVPEMGVTTDVPVILNNVSVSDEYDGSFDQRRFVTHTLNFQMKINLFGPVSGQNIITKVDANVGQTSVTGTNRNYTATGNPVDSSITSESWTGQGL